ncbi:ISAs1 family transposase [Hahella sp. HN01]|nr:ISAs1 family transposase [Hahella sp. HN01]MBU6955634.1 ISAs1 family transposase [Hahella sp. HN01]
MGSLLIDGVKHHFSSLPDLRRETLRHNFYDVLIITRFGDAKKEWFESFLELPNGIPSHDTFNNIFAKLDPDEKRRCRVSTILEGLEKLQSRWQDLKNFIVVKTERMESGQRTLECRLYISSREGDARYFLDATRKHWHIENKLHWVLNVAFKEDDSRHRMGHSAENLAVLRHMALNLLKNEKTDKGGIKTKRLRAGRDHGYLKKVLSGLATLWPHSAICLG